MINPATLDVQSTLFAAAVASTTKAPVVALAASKTISVAEVGGPELSTPADETFDHVPAAE